MHLTAVVRKDHWIESGSISMLVVLLEFHQYINASKGLRLCMWSWFHAMDI